MRSTPLSTRVLIVSSMKSGVTVSVGPFVHVLRTTSQNHKQTARLETFYQAVEHGLSLDVGPLHVLEPKQERTSRGAAKKQVLHGRHHSLPTDRGVESRPIGILDGKVKYRLQCRKIGR